MAIDQTLVKGAFVVVKFPDIYELNPPELLVITLVTVTIFSDKTSEDCKLKALKSLIGAPGASNVAFKVESLSVV